MLSDSKLYKKKLHGWLSYAFASEVFVIVSLTLFLPICLEQFARDNGFLLPDRTERCSPVVKLDARDATPIPDARCVVKIGWLWIDSASFSLYVYSISVALQAITVISMGGIADHPPHRKMLLLMFALLGAISATIFLLLPSSSPLWFLSAPLAVCANVGFGASVVAMNAYLPTLAKESPEVQEILEDLGSKQDSSTALDGQEHHSDMGSEHPDSPLILRAPSDEVEDLKARYDAELSRVTSRISSLGIAMGYGAGIFLLIIALIPVTMLHGSTFSLRLAIGLSGIWWAVFSIPAALWLPGAESSRIPATAWSDDADTASSGEWSTRREIVKAWKRLGSMLRWGEIKKLRNTFKYLAAWFLLSDGFTTITSTAILFGKTTLNMQPSALILIGVLTPTSGILGSLAWPVLQRRYGWTNLKVIVILVVMASAIPAYGCLGFLQVFQGGSTRFGGLTTQGEMFGLAVYFGSVYGAFQGYARAFYAELLPPGEEARWYGLFSITDKSSSFLGPLIVGIIADTTGNIRYAFFFLVIMIWIAVPILMVVDVEKGRKDAREYRYSVTGVHST
ncbi:Autophagy-related protein 22-1 [Hypsizygus marmoreus]|uniref:Autophagy-related protein n=1 Tax=Hypsizygus marmoreus TaxID=39966 RepID=A0A369JT54_HYPMA|nr:Autophagy-related protein 22-1 [Hypsizygus marmoreus]